MKFNVSIAAWSRNQKLADHKVTGLGVRSYRFQFQLCHQLGEHRITCQGPGQFSEWSVLRMWSIFQLMKTPQRSEMRRSRASLERKMMVNTFFQIAFGLMVTGFFLVIPTRFRLLRPSARARLAEGPPGDGQTHWPAVPVLLPLRSCHCWWEWCPSRGLASSTATWESQGRKTAQNGAMLLKKNIFGYNRTSPHWSNGKKQRQ